MARPQEQNATDHGRYNMARHGTSRPSGCTDVCTPGADSTAAGRRRSCRIKGTSSSARVSAIRSRRAIRRRGRRLAARKAPASFRREPRRRACLVRRRTGERETGVAPSYAPTSTTRPSNPSLALESTMSRIRMKWRRFSQQLKRSRRSSRRVGSAMPSSTNLFRRSLSSRWRLGQVLRPSSTLATRLLYQV